MTESPVVHGVPPDRADHRQPEARKSDAWRWKVGNATGNCRQRRDDADHRVDDRGVAGNTEIRANPAPDEQVSGQAQAAGDCEEIAAECAAVDADVTRARDD